MCLIGEETMWIEYMIEIRKKFYVEFFSKRGKKANSLNHLREIMYTIPKYIPIFPTPHNRRAFRFHMLPAYLEVNTCKNLELSKGMSMGS